MSKENKETSFGHVVQEFLEQGPEVLVNYFPLERSEIAIILQNTWSSIEKGSPLPLNATGKPSRDDLHQCLERNKFKAALSHELNTILPDQAAIIDVGIDGLFFSYFRST